MNIFWEMHQQSRIGEATGAANAAKQSSKRAEGDIRRMQRQLDRVTIACQAMWELVREHSDLTEEMLEERIGEIDLRDGVADGKMGPQVITCGQCGHKTNSKRGFCVMCGEPVQGDHILQG